MNFLYPEYAEIKCKKYKINTSFSVALKCLKINNDENISDFERALAIIYLLFGFIPDDDIELFLEKAIKYLECGEKPKDIEQEKDMDYEKDWKYIVASFMSDYSIDLSKVDLHFWQFYTLIQGLTEKSVLNRVRGIRSYDLSSIKDEKFKEKMKKAKKEVALDEEEYSDEELEQINEFNNLF